MAKPTTVYLCQNCGHWAPKWLGKCPECDAWNSFVEEIQRAAPPASARFKTPSATAGEESCWPITEVPSLPGTRLSSGIPEFDRTLGGGLVEGSLVLIGGNPGIGKSTLALQCMGKLAQSGKKTLYVSGEESPAQIKMRAERLGVLSDDLLISSEICIEDVLRLIDRVRPAAVVLDSIQTFYTQELSSAPGSIGQVREVAFRLFQDIKRRDMPAILIGHITKDGALAGPKSLEHIVDTVTYFEGEKAYAYRLLRTTKNRFGSAPEIGVFEMREQGLVPVENPSEIFLSERSVDSPGSAIVSSLEGSRPLLVEVQALVSPSSSPGMPRRMATGFDQNRMTLLIAIMEKRLGLHLQAEDVFVNVAGGIKVTEPAVDLGVAAAIAGSFQNLVIDPQLVLIGEIGLTGEVRSVAQLESRILEAERLGFKRVVLPGSARKGKGLSKKNIRPHYVDSLAEAFETAFQSS